ncbi:hypothetical protein BKA67DRAFT_580918 [Truncatella angustata]|uniref:Aminoglycoside phosphotransferase domain-containing protein n=1 Tax=Truncatella angustata TaxID=152316 RepID=A0A9P8RMF8_9PEZI|nr:uncharacterized protein BKA67DRAFT_580918 [Truncatella angustata]KAH6646918.1 hypothetical protein BKA67DRAFT_580918 [Truncatella angustata]KAH8196560.1 hypothetical protein TruAng_009288 [Truncatella angustata]
MAPYDFIAEKNNQDERLAFARKLLDARDEIVSFVDSRLKWDGAGKYDGFFKGSFNISLDVKRGDNGEHVLIRFPAPGNIYGPWRDEKVKNEVMVMKYLSENSNIPVPGVRCWGLTKDSPRQLGPFIIMDFVGGQDLSDLLQLPAENEKDAIILDPDIDETRLDIIYEQIASFMLELSRLEFPRIGAISKNATGQWSVTGRPLTYDMNEVVTLGGYLAEELVIKEPFDHSGAYFAARAQCLQAHLEAQRNIAGDDEDLARDEFVARRGFAKLIPEHGIIDDNGPFLLFCDDLRPTNMLVNPNTLRITAVLDWEFTNTMPSQYANDVPWWLLLKQPASWVCDGEIQEFLDLFIPRMEQFIRAVIRIEAKSPPIAGQLRLSARMRDSWDSGRFWFNLASRSSFDFGEIFWDALHKKDLRGGILDMATLAEKESFVKRKMDQFDKYRKERESDGRFC